ncbi:MAG TPA: Gfo/Idh/MocA family oxidoreductase [Armatimonadota bacterium]|nr:Gfo/Idh/MocA family oxidoreductase [Armatimonadota bacterium]
MNTLSTAVIGLGRVGWQFHIPHILAHDGFQLTAVVDPLDERRAEARQTFGVQGYADYAELLERETPDLIVLASPTHLHAEQAIQAMARGIDVFCDKPMARSLAEVDAMIAAMRAHGRKLMVFQPHRVTNEAAAIRHILARDWLGEIFMVRRTLCSYTRRNDWQAFTEYGGGMLNNFGAHCLDQVLHLFGFGVRRCDCHLRKIASLGDADDVVKALVELENGAIVDIEINMACGVSIPNWTICGRRGTAIHQGDRFIVRYYRDDELAHLGLQDGLAAANRKYGNEDVIPWRTEELPLADYPGADFYDHCYAYYAEDKPPFVPVEETREVMRLLGAFRACAGW